MASHPDLPTPRSGGPSPAATTSVGLAAAAVLVFAGVALVGLESCTPGADSPRPIEAVPTVESQPQPQPVPPSDPPPSDYAPPPPDYDPGAPNRPGYAPPPPPVRPDPPPEPPPEPRRPPDPPPRHPPPVT